MNVSLSELYLAYRRAKKEAFRDPNCAHGLKFAEFESDLSGNIGRLQRTLNRQRPVWQRTIAFIGEVTCIPKSIEKPEQENQRQSIHCQESAPLAQWRRECSRERPAEADFRPVINATVPFMIVSALWIQRVGHLYDATLDTRYAVGSRLRRWRPSPEAPPGTTGELNPISHDLFQPYYHAYGKWRSHGLRAMRRELEEGHRIVAVTMDLQRFYHQVDAAFLLHEDYLNTIGINLDAEQREFTDLLIQAIQTWNGVAHATFNGGIYGLPVGLTASQLIANVLLQQFDRHLALELAPVYYARYVDDIFLVIRHPEPFENGGAFIEWLGGRLHPIASVRRQNPGAPNDGLAIRLEFSYAEHSELLFVGKKQKIFQLEGPHGIDLIGPIEEQIRAQTSEHCDMPKLPRSENEMAHRALLVTPDASLAPDSLRKADAVTLRRSGFAMLLADVEAHARDLDPRSWAELRHEFIALSHRQLLAPKAFFDYFRYFPRVLGVMVACGDHAEARRFVRGFVPLLQVLEETCIAVGQPPCRESLRISTRNLAARIVEAVLQSVSESTRQVRLLIGDICQHLSAEFACPRSDDEITEAVANFRRIDWSRYSYASLWLNAADNEVSPTRPRTPAIREVLRFEAIDIFRDSAGLMQPYWPALSFPTRPIPQRDITTRAPALLENGREFSDVIQGLRGSWMPPFTSLEYFRDSDDGPLSILIPNRRHSNRPTVALTSLDVSDHEWAAAAAGTPSLTIERYRRLNSLLDAVVAFNPRPQYVLFPECSLPRRWALPMAAKVLGRGVSVIGGLEYRHDTTDDAVLHNEALIGLRTTFPGYPTNLFFCQPKQRAAWHEREELLNRFGMHLQNSNGESYPVYVHGRFCFGLLICSELTNIENRARFQGKVDALFIPEWNQDIESFSALVEASALDVHSYVIQANNRRFGDSRIRAPFRVPHQRDVIRVKGGENDYFVVGQIDYMALRRFQSHQVPPSGDDAAYKPFPLGFPDRLSARRRTIPS